LSLEIYLLIRKKKSTKIIVMSMNENYLIEDSKMLDKENKLMDQSVVQSSSMDRWLMLLEYSNRSVALARNKMLIKIKEKMKNIPLMEEELELMVILPRRILDQYAM
jgi:hypothetical protein